jgi:hypothetical protein
VNVFVLGCSRSDRADAGAARSALADLAARVPFFPEPYIEIWTSTTGDVTAGSLAHHPDRLGGVRYTCFQPDRMALFAGRPFRWTDEFEADGRAVLEPELYLRPAREWLEGLEGRCAVARWDDAGRVLELYTDLMGSYPVFWTEIAGTKWISNSAELLRSLKGTRELRRSALAALLGCDHSLDGEAWWEGIHRLPRAAICRFHSTGRMESSERLPLEEIANFFGRGFEPAAAAQLVTAGVAACADWPGRPSIVPLTAGRDSRIILAAALRAGIDFEAMTVAFPWSPGWPETQDVRVARSLCAELGVVHRHAPLGPEAAVFRSPALNARTLARVTPVPVCQYDAMTLPSKLPDGPLELLHMGLGGELARAYFGLGDGLDADGLVEHLAHILMPRWPSTLLSTQGRELVLETVRAHVDKYLDAGVAAADVPDVFYLNNRMASWAGGVQGTHDYVQDTVSALWALPLLRHEYGLPARIRPRQVFVRDVLQELSPALVRHAFQGNPWRAWTTPRLERLMHAGRVLSEEAKLRRKIREPSWRGRSPLDLFARHLELLREYVAGYPIHPAWDALDRHGVKRLLRRPTALWDRRSRAYAWRLGTVFMGELSGAPTLDQSFEHPSER